MFKKKSKQKTFIWCPACNNEFVSSNSFVSDEEGIVTYKCSRCGNMEKYDFDHFPIPVSLKKLKGVE